MTAVERERPARAGDLGTKRAALRAFFGYSSPRVVTTAAAVGVLVRLALGNWSVGDALVLGATILLTGLVEWVIHLFLLHAPADAWTTRHLGTGINHRKHHLDPPELRWLLLGGIDAVVFVVLIAGFTAAWSVPLLWLTGQPLALPYLTALALAWLGLAHYEWTHLLVHTRYRPRTRYYARLARNHRLHHFRNERYWLGITSNLGDRILGSYPRDKTDVPLSETARTLDQPRS